MSTILTLRGVQAELAKRHFETSDDLRVGLVEARQTINSAVKTLKQFLEECDEDQRRTTFSDINYVTEALEKLIS